MQSAHGAYSTNSTIYIRADGSVNPSDAPIINDHDTTYTLTDEIYCTSGQNGLVVERSSITLDGNGHTLNGSNRLGFGISLSSYHISNVTIQNICVNGFESCIVISGSNNILRWNNFTGGENGVQLVGTKLPPAPASNNIIDGNNVTENDVGVYLYESSNNNVTNNNMANNLGAGIYLESSPSNIVVGNNMRNDSPGIGFYLSSNCKIYNNNIDGWFIDSGSKNVWDDGHRGNYWSEYLTQSPGASEIDNSGIWDTPYVIDDNNVDHYPLVNYIAIPEFPIALALPMFMVATMLVTIFYRKQNRPKWRQKYRQA